ncbi:MAG: Ni/Fe-hydrogenase cytochrome b subunit [Nitrospirae bacterium]|nr:Ni/Fe-hydrogenase cytochrome b subunit [Nitrospirota bacterium]
MSDRAEAVGGPILTTVTRWMLGIGVIGGILMVWRFAVGLGRSTGLNDGYPWGLWISFDVVTGTALGCGGFAMALLVYIFNKGKYHPLVRPAILTSALGYSLEGLAIALDVGRPWFIFRIPLGGFPDMGKYNWNSSLLVVALCVIAYIIVLWIELSPAFFEKWKDSPKQGLANFSRKAYGFLEKALLWIIALGVLLPAMHQSSLGSVMLLSGPRLHSLWNTPFLPLLFLISCITMGYAVVVMESALSSRVFDRPPHASMLADIGKVAAYTVWIFLVIRLVDLVVRGRVGLMFKFDGYALMFWIEVVCFLVPAVMLMNNQKRQNLGYLFRAAMMLVLAGTLYRFDTYLVAFMPGENFSYFPTLPELFITFGIVAIEILLYVVLVKRFPILAGKPTTAAAH